MSSNWLSDSLRCIWSFICGSIRLILFLGILIFVLIQALWAVYLVFVQTPYDGIASDNGRKLLTYLYLFSILVVALFGCYGAFYRHNWSLRAFTLLSALNTALLIWILISKGPNEMQTFNKNLEEQLKQYEPKYNWFGVHFNPNATVDEIVASDTWDRLQLADCCGWAGPADWDSFRPSNVSSDKYPKTCCPHIVNEFCTTENGLYTRGCVDVVLEWQMFELRIYIAFVGVQVVLCLLSCIVAFLNLDVTHNIRTESQSHIYRTNPNPIAMYPR